MKDVEIEDWDKNTSLLKGIYLSEFIEEAKKLEHHQGKNHPTQ